MLEAMTVALPLIMTAVLLTSGIAKIRTPDDLAGWAELGVPSVLRRGWLVRLHPWGEIVLGVLLAVLGGVLGLIAAVITSALMAAYTWLVVRAYRSGDDASCACFGTSARVTGMTVIRNVWLTLLAVGVASVIWLNPLLGGAVARADWSWVFASAVAAVTVVFVMWRDAEQPVIPEPVAVTASEDEYVRARTPAVPVTLADGTLVNLRELTARRPLLLLAVSQTCGACTSVIDGLPAYRALLPELDVRLLVQQPAESSGLADAAEPQSLHDPYGYVRGSIAEWGTPTAVLFGVDGLLAGGPESGPETVDSFVEDIYESLHGERPQTGWREAETVTPTAG